MIDKVLSPKNEWYMWDLANIMGRNLVNTYDRSEWADWEWSLAFWLYHIRPF